MKKRLAAFFSWFGGVIFIFGGLTYLLVGQYQIKTTETCYNTGWILVPCQQTTDYQHFEYPLWMWLIFGIVSAIIVVALIIRDILVVNGKKIVAGIITILFASVIGGIFTLLIPKNQLNIKNVRIEDLDTPTSFKNESVERPKKLKLRDYQKMYEQGKISSDILYLQRKTFFITLFSTITSWIGGVISSASGYIFLYLGYDSYESTNNILTKELVHHDFPNYVWILWSIFVLILMGLLAYREYVVRRGGNKRSIAIAVLILASIPGGILTLLIPEEAEHVDNGYSDRVVRLNQNKEQ